MIFTTHNSRPTCKHKEFQWKRAVNWKEAAFGKLCAALSKKNDISHIFFSAICEQEIYETVALGI
jgi:mannitol/fructose-specific phosphotransferase system IIA component